MARIRTIKPEFWDSPSMIGSSPWARLLFIALWNWADDHGRGTANLKELEGFAFPNDDRFTDSSGNTVHFRDLVAEVSARFGVVFYTVENRPYFEIPSWDKHQRNERRSKESKFPSPQVRDDVAEMRGNTVQADGVSGTGTGEQGNRGTGEQTSSSDSADAEIRPDVEELFEHFNQTLTAREVKPAKKNKANLNALRLLIERDGYTPEQIRWIIDWTARDNFWGKNILSPAKLREKFDQLKLNATNQRPQGRQSSAAAGLAEVASWTTPEHLLLEP
jgi:hypothetical protein